MKLSYQNWSSVSSLISLRMSRFLAFAKQLFIRQPLLANCIAYGGLYSGAEFTQQILMKKALVRKYFFIIQWGSEYWLVPYSNGPKLYSHWIVWFSESSEYQNSIRALRTLLCLKLLNSSLEFEWNLNTGLKFWWFWSSCCIFRPALGWCTLKCKLRSPFSMFFAVFARISGES